MGTCSPELDAPVLSHALNEDEFRSVIIRERKRTERSGLAIVLLLIHLEEGQRVSSDVWEGIGTALQSVKGDIDLIGWFKRNASMGLLVPDLDVSELTVFCERMERAISKALSSLLDDAVTSRLFIRLRVYPEPMRSEEEAFLSIDPYLFPEVYAREGARSGYESVKRILDVIASALLLFILSPLLLAVAFAVKLSSDGPVIFRQIRIGQRMKPFLICKFRTMRANADQGVHHKYVSWFITASDKQKSQAAEENNVFKLTNDPRITPIGHFLRKTSLDELPQLWNVLKGEMSLVGPRPPLWYELQQYKAWHRHRVLEVKPGITGLWQVNGRSRTTFDEMVRLDLRYAKTRSLWTDIKILLATPQAVISGKGAC